MLMVTILVGCAIACQARPSTSYYRPYYQEKYYVSDGYDNGDGYRSHEDSGHRQRHHSHDNHEASEYDSGAAKSLKDRIKKNSHSEGAKEAVHASGGKEEHGKKSHDKAFYEREKKYGYEKSYGYEKETKHHDKGSVSHSSGSNYNHKENKEHHKNGEQFLRDLAEEAKKFDRGSKSQGSKSDRFDSSSHRNIGKDIESELARSMKFFKRSGPISNYSPNFVPKEYLFGLDKGFNRLKYMSGIHGLGGLRAHGLNYGFNPMRYRYNDNNVGTKLGFMPHGDLLFDLEHPASSVLYYDPDSDL